ncbi:MAG: hypothetical protein KC478_10570, partial [Bacteriovoracaceae bacterium]|nr:hypothetical protein [Bacteriovoracaceae bacterium]
MKLLISILLLSCICLGQVSSTCKSILSDMISSGQIEGEKLQKFLNLQAGISLHRLAYASLRHSRSKEQFRLEKEILSMLEQMRDKRKSEPEFNKVYELFNHPDNKLSRTALAEVLPYLKDIINEQNGEQSSFKRKYFNIGLADVRMLAILAEREKSRDGRYAHSQFKDHAYDQSILNFTKIINSSVANSGEVSKAHKLESMQSRLNELNKQALNLLEGMGMPMECQSLLNACVERSGDKVLIEDGFMNLISKVIEESDTIDLHEQLRYDDVWLHVNSKISGTSSGDIDLQKDPSTVVVDDEVVVRRPNPTPRPKEVEFKFSEIDDRVVIENYLVQKVLDSIPYFFTREELESNMDFTLALAQAIDDGILAKKGKNRTFRYENAIYYLPETWNSEYSLPGNFGARAGELLSRRWNQFFRFDSEVDVSHIPKKDRDNFLTTLNDQAKDHEHAFSF